MDDRIGEFGLNVVASLIATLISVLVARLVLLKSFSRTANPALAKVLVQIGNIRASDPAGSLLPRPRMRLILTSLAAGALLIFVDFYSSSSPFPLRTPDDPPTRLELLRGEAEGARSKGEHEAADIISQAQRTADGLLEPRGAAATRESLEIAREEASRLLVDAHKQADGVFEAGRARASDLERKADDLMATQKPTSVYSRHAARGLLTMPLRAAVLLGALGIALRSWGMTAVGPNPAVACLIYALAIGVTNVLSPSVANPFVHLLPLLVAGAIAVQSRLDATIGQCILGGIKLIYERFGYALVCLAMVWVLSDGLFFCGIKGGAWVEASMNSEPLNPGNNLVSGHTLTNGRDVFSPVSAILSNDATLLFSWLGAVVGLNVGYVWTTFAFASVLLGVGPPGRSFPPLQEAARAHHREATSRPAKPPAGGDPPDDPTSSA